MLSRVSSGPIIMGSKDYLEQIKQYANKRSYPANCSINYPESVNNYLYYLLSGEILISNYTSCGDINRLFILRKNSILGLVSMFSQSEVKASWLTLTPCECYVFKREDVYTKIPRDYLLNFLEQIATMSKSISRRFAKGSSSRLEVRFARMLIHLVHACLPEIDKLEKKFDIKPNITQRLTSELLGMHHVTLNRIAREFRNEKIIGQFNKNKLEIINYKSLQEYANGLMPPLKF